MKPLQISNYLIYKPYGMLSQFTHELGSNWNCLKDLPFTFPKDVYPVGRLDADSEGLLILSNDSALKTAYLGPESQIPKKYLCQVEGSIDNKAISTLLQGVEIKHKGKVVFCKAKKASFTSESIMDLPRRNPPIRFRQNIPTSWVTISINEGKNRQVRKMLAQVGFPVLRLVRVAIGNIELGRTHHLNDLQKNVWKLSSDIKIF